ncbi:TRAP transporter small permease subunit [Granulosicoccus sp.]|nr:TRAP transporter small permease subunit [Granulosicoccus sp.]MDB4223493.1 TRAP transporter small permease subunit [Granulosicoccus sp.]
MKPLSRSLERVLELILMLLMIGLTAIVVIAVVYRKFDASLSWYDEVASITLAWITFYGGALAVLKRKHIGFDSVLLAVPMPVRMYLAIFGEFVFIAFFALLAWAGWEVLLVLEGDNLVSLRWVPVQFTQSVIPIGAVLFIICELLAAPDYFKLVASGQSAEHLEIEAEIAAEMKRS